jgi:hypothetical protein
VPKLHLQVTSIICGHAVRIQESNCLASAEDDYINTKPGCSNLLGMGPENRLFATFLTESKIPKSKSQKRRGRRKEKVLYFSNTPRTSLGLRVKPETCSTKTGKPDIHCQKYETFVIVVTLQTQ